jgi:methyltransferase
VTTIVAFGLVLAVIALHRLTELLVSRRHAGGRRCEPDARGAWPAMVLLHTASVTLPLAEVVALERPFTPALAAAAAAVFACALALRVWTLSTLGAAWNVRILVPAEEAIVTTGPYAWIRHPNYLVVILELLALPLLHGAWLSSLTLSLWNGLVLSRRIPAEEAALARSPAWRRAMADRPRLLPRLAHRQKA